MNKVWGFISRASHSRTTAVLVILILFASVPLTVFVAQKQQQTQQRAEIPSKPLLPLTLQNTSDVYYSCIENTAVGYEISTNQQIENASCPGGCAKLENGVTCYFQGTYMTPTPPISGGIPCNSDADCAPELGRGMLSSGICDPLLKICQAPTAAIYGNVNIKSNGGTYKKVIVGIYKLRDENDSSKGGELIKTITVNDTFQSSDNSFLYSYEKLILNTRYIVNVVVLNNYDNVIKESDRTIDCPSSPQETYLRDCVVTAPNAQNFIITLSAIAPQTPAPTVCATHGGYNSYVGPSCGGIDPGTSGRQQGLGCGKPYQDVSRCADGQLDFQTCTTNDCINACKSSYWCPQGGPGVR